MPQFRTARRVRHSAGDMFDLVADMERYPEFVPLCQSMRVRKRATGGEGIETVVADMTVAYKIVRETFTSRVTLDRPNLQILVEYLNGPFSRMENRWEFHPVAERACEVEFFISYEFKSRVFAMLMGAMFETAFRRFAEAFERRADKVYGRMNTA
jgi:coenzyme Q-binding protein COQ10